MIARRSKSPGADQRAGGHVAARKNVLHCDGKSFDTANAGGHTAQTRNASYAMSTISSGR